MVRQVRKDAGCRAYSVASLKAMSTCRCGTVEVRRCILDVRAKKVDGPTWRFEATKSCHVPQDLEFSSET